MNQTATLPCDREQARNRKLIVRDAILCALEDAGYAMTPHQIRKRTGLGLCIIGFCVNSWPRYFAVRYCDKSHIQEVDRHHHLKGFA